MRILTTLLLSLTTLAAYAQVSTPVPEPSTITLLGVAAVAGITAAIARKRRK